MMQSMHCNDRHFQDDLLCDLIRQTLRGAMRTRCVEDHSCFFKLL